MVLRIETKEGEEKEKAIALSKTTALRRRTPESIRVMLLTACMACMMWTTSLDFTLSFFLFLKNLRFLNLG
jgi:hypothetical protein